MQDLINRQAAIYSLSLSKEILSRVLDNIDIVGMDGEKYSWGLRLIEANINYIEALPSVEPQYTELTPEEAASEIASGSTMSGWYWLDDMIQLKQMGYAICRKKG